jgi:hypothetical protein
VELKVSRILHAGYLFEAKGTRILCDPIFESPFSRNCFAFPGIEFDIAALRQERFDAVFISHYHDDHLSFESLDLIDRATPIFLFCIHSQMFEMLRELGFRHVHSLDLKMPVTVGAFTVTAHPALDRDVDSIFEIEAVGIRVLNVVDSWIDPDVFAQLKMKRWDLVLWPFQTMRELEVLSPSPALSAAPEIPHEWLEQLSSLEAKTIVPSSCQFRFEDWSWLNQAFFPVSYQMFEQAVRAVAPGVNVVRMDPGQAFSLTSKGLSPAPRVTWITPVGDQSLDYSMVPGAVPSSTAEIAKRFAGLTDAESALLEAFLTTLIFDRFDRLEFSDGTWFDQPRKWRLAVYDHVGKRTDHYYLVHRRGLKRLDSLSGLADWTTEVVARKLLDALTIGESMTSMYLRIKRGHAPNLDADPHAPDLMEDPLLRVLFDDNFGAYQRAQLVTLVQRAENPRRST